MLISCATAKLAAHSDKLKNQNKSCRDKLHRPFSLETNHYYISRKTIFIHREVEIFMLEIISTELKGRAAAQTDWMTNKR
jgi:hypothetical protein